jgi:hypothetical protein
MTWYPTVGQRVDESPNGWTAAGGPRERASPFLEEEGFTMEDWNLATSDAIPDPLHQGPGDAPRVVFGFGQGKVGQDRLRKAKLDRGEHRFDVVFFTAAGADWANTTCWAQGVYRNATWLNEGERRKVIASPAWLAFRARREAQFVALYPGDPAGILRRYRKYLHDEIKWRVAVEDILRPKAPVAFKPPGYSLRFTNAFDWSARQWWQWLNLPGPAFP